MTIVDVADVDEILDLFPGTGGCGDVFAMGQPLSNAKRVKAK